MECHLLKLKNMSNKLKEKGSIAYNIDRDWQVKAVQ